MRIGLAVSSLVVVCAVPCVAAETMIIPLPQQVKHKDGEFSLVAASTIVYADEKAKRPASLLAEYLRPSTGRPLPVKEGAAGKKHDILLTTTGADPKWGTEGYSLTAGLSGLTITATESAGFFYGTQTVRQLLPADAFSSVKGTQTDWSINGIEIVDKPRFEWRGMMLDVSRYFFNKDFVLRFLDIMAMHKLNVLHWHLIDDPGWRLEIKTYPRLTRIGGFRGKGNERYGGFYTQADIREIVRYASDRHITIVPEVELPAHTLSAIVAYPHLCCTGKKMEIPTRHFISRDLYCAGKESTWAFLENVMAEVCDLFPGRFVHIGGDEAKYDRWKKCPDCQKKIKELGLNSEKQLQGWMTCRIEKFLQKRNKQIIGWDEILHCGVTKDAGIMTWHRPRTAVDGAKRGNKVVMALTGHCYFDTAESKLPGEPPCATWLPPISLKQAYTWDPMPSGLSGKSAANILGAEGCVWSDQFIHRRGHLIADKKGEGTRRSERYIEYLCMPRMAALAEVTWTEKGRREWDGFSSRLSRMLLRYMHAGFTFRMPQPIITVEKKTNGQKVITAKSPIEAGTVRYTLDGSEPTAAASILKAPISVPANSIFKAVAVSPDGKRISLAYVQADGTGKYARHGKELGHWKSGKVASRKPQEISFDATGLIDSNGTYIITFIYTGGRERLDIHRVTIVKNDREQIAEDKHFGFTGGKAKDNQYKVTIKAYETGAAFKVVAWVCGDVGNDSNGVVLIRKAK